MPNTVKQKICKIVQKVLFLCFLIYADKSDNILHYIHIMIVEKCFWTLKQPNRYRLLALIIEERTPVDHCVPRI